MAESASSLLAHLSSQPMLVVPDLSHLLLRSVPKLSEVAGCYSDLATQDGRESSIVDLDSAEQADSNGLPSVDLLTPRHLHQHFR